MAVDSLCFVSLPAYGFFNPSAYEQTGGGGAKRQIYLLSQELTQWFDVHVVVGDYGQPKTECRDGVTLHRAYTPGDGAPHRQLFSLGKAMYRAAADVYIYRGHPRKAAITGLLARLLRRKWVYHVSNDSDLGYNYDNCSTLVRWLFRHELNQAYRIVAQTTRQQNLLRNRFDVNSTVIPNGYVASEELPLEEREFVLWVGRLEPQQNRPDLFLDCAEALPEVSFKIIGVREDDECYHETKRRADSLPNVEFISAVEPNEIHKYYRRAIAVVNTSAHEGFPNTFLEAWRQQTPVVSLDVDPGRYLEDDLYSGYAAGEIDTVIEETRQLATDSRRRARIGENLERHFHQEYDIGRVGEQYARVLGGVV